MEDLDRELDKVHVILDNYVKLMGLVKQVNIVSTNFIIACINIIYY